MNTRDAKTLANKLMREHELKQNGWVFKFDQAKRRFGQCDYRNKTISLSEPLTLLNPKSQINDTILHEIAHALTPGAHHGARWKSKAAEIGADPSRCYDSSVVQPEAKYIGVCPNGHEHTAMRMTRGMRTTSTACGICCNGRYNAEFIIAWQSVVRFA